MKPNIAEYKKMLAAATPGPWAYEETDSGHIIRMGTAIESPYHHDSQHAIEYDHCCYYDDDEEENDAENSQANEAAANAKLIAKAPEAIESLIGEVERQAEEIERLRKALEWYADNSNYKLGATTLGNRAREALRRDTPDA
ncbi:hypothetical protein [Paenibacillus sp. GYB003]|uniref:hypothetical protein n=1 Tax=Paenibacillus sp. GYB003 TaxID=2994392 RepID=UPI002F961C8F